MLEQIWANNFFIKVCLDYYPIRVQSRVCMTMKYIVVMASGKT